MLRDQGAVRDLTDSLAEGLRRHVADVRKRVPGATVLLQLDEPSLPGVLAGRVPTESGLSAYKAVDTPEAAARLRTVVEAVDAPVVLHCCAPDVPWQVLRDASVAAAAFDLSLIKDLDPIGEAIEAGLGLFVGAAPARPEPGTRPDSKRIAERVQKLWGRLGFPPALLPRQVVVTPACGLAGAPLPYVRGLLKACQEAALRISEV